MSAGDPPAAKEPVNPATPAGPVGGERRARLPFPVVGIGASAGGLEALTEMFDAVDAKPGMAFVVIQHLPPEHQSLLSEILSRHTPMPVAMIEEGVQILPDHVYVIRPGNTITVKDGALHLGGSVLERQHRRPVDDFFRSLATEQKEQAIIVVLSGMGSDGTAGAQAVKAAGGVCIAQRPETAAFSSMPDSLIRAGYADQVLSPKEIPPLLLRYVAHASAAPDAEAIVAVRGEAERLREVLALLRTRLGRDFTGYRTATLTRRVQRRMALAGLDHVGEYVALLREKSDELGALGNDLTINVTGFFRDEQAWESLRKTAIAPLVASREPGSELRAWVSACSSGEEAYSLAMLIEEEMEACDRLFDVKIFATDTADRSVALARAGLYPNGIEGDISPERLDRFFDKAGDNYQIKKRVRDRVVFAPQNVLKDPPFSRIDICTCRNLLIYLEPTTQKHVLEMFHFALREDGILFLGPAEGFNAGDFSFEPLDKKWRIFRRLGGRSRLREVLPYHARAPEELRAVLQVQEESVSSAGIAQRALLKTYAPPSVLVDRRDQIIYFHGNTEDFLKLPDGEPTRSLFDLLRPRLAPQVRQVLRTVMGGGASPSTVTTIDDEGATSQAISILAEAVGDANPPAYFLLSFRTEADAHLPTVPTTPVPHVAPDLEVEVRILRRELEGSMEAFEASHEELRASSEEVTSINEELQSANEELETSKEELQAVNEELTTVNSQLRTKLGELEGINNDLANLLSSTDIAVVFLDTELRVRRFTPAISDLIEMIAGDLGRPLTDLAQKFEAADLAAEARQVLRRLTAIEAETRSHSGRWYLRRVLPYRTSDDRIGGVVITFVDISARKAAEAQTAAGEARLREVLHQLPAAVLLVEAQTGRLLFGNQRSAEVFGEALPLPQIAAPWSAVAPRLQGFRSNGDPYLPQEWPLARSLATGETVAGEEMAIAKPDGGPALFSVSSAPLREPDGSVGTVMAVFADITSRRRAEDGMREANARFKLIVDSARDFAIFLIDPQGRVATWNIGAEYILGWTENEMLGRNVVELFVPEDRTAGVPHAELAQAAARGEARDDRWHLRKDGTRFWASGVLAAVRDERGALGGFVKIMHDDTDRKQFEERLHRASLEAEQSRDLAEQANRAKDDFIATLSHELRTPLNTIRMWSRLLLQPELPRSDAVEGVRAIDRATISQQQLIDELLDVSRIASGKMRIEPRAVQVHNVLTGAIETVRPVAAARQIVLDVAVDNETGLVHADPDRLQQVIWNLLSNAIKFTPSGGTVRIAAKRVAKTIHIEVSDTGIGIRKEFLPHVFDAFRQAETGTARHHSGLGLGLSIAKKLVDLHNGRITVESDGEGSGTRFTVVLPAVDEAVDDLLDDDVGAPLTTPASNLRGINVLLVEDEELTRDSTARYLTSMGARVVAVSSVAAGLDALAAELPDVLISDIGLPGEDGYSLVQKLRASDTLGGAALPAIALTAFARPEDRRRALLAGFDEHIVKASDPAYLVQAIARFTRRRLS
jgi:two-component system, chemotaxis family, CheB/CheR fusion protein